MSRIGIGIWMIVLCAQQAAAQLQQEWHFGGWEIGIGLNFSTNPPTVVPTSYTGATGSGASITDPDGQLLFYTDGSRVWDKTHNLMPNGNGLQFTGSCGWYNTLQQRDGMIIQPIPFDSNRYYIFSIPYAQCMDPSGQGIYYPSSLYYSIVDMSLNGGLGDIVPGEKGVLIDQGLSTGGLCIVPGNNCDYWLLAHTYYLSDNPYYLGYNQTPPDTTFRAQGLLAYHITEDGIDMDPVHTVITDPSYLAQDVPSNFIPIVSSHDRSKLLVMNLLGRFDPGTGIFSDYFRLFPAANFISYGCGVNNAQFSPNDQKLYVSAVVQDGWGATLYDTEQGIFQFDLSAFDYYPVRQSKKMVYSQYSGLPEPDDWRSVGQVRLTPHNEIYFISRVGFGYLYGGDTFRDELNTIVNPDADYADLIVQEDILFIGPDTVHYGWGLPTPIHNRLYISDTQRQVYAYPAECGPDKLLSIPGNAYNVLWDDLTTANTRVVDTAGHYWVQYQLPGEHCRIYADSFEVGFSAWNGIDMAIQPTCTGADEGKAMVSHVMDHPGLSQEFSWYSESGLLLHQTTSDTGDLLEGLAAGDYNLTISLSNGCDTTLPFTIAAYPQEPLTVTPSEVRIRYGDSVQLQASGADLYHWWPSGTVSNDTIAAPFVRPMAPTVYTVLGLTFNGCRDTAYVHVDIDYTLPDFVPNAFSPNGDGLNDVFKVSGITYQKLLAFRIFNRWGAMVFESSDPDRGWDGTSQGKGCDVGTYYYQVILSYPDGRLNTLKGDVLLIR